MDANTPTFPARLLPRRVVYTAVYMVVCVFLFVVASCVYSSFLSVELEGGLESSASSCITEA